MKNKLSGALIFGGMALTGLIAGAATMAGAQSIGGTATTTNTALTATTKIDTPEAGDVADTPGSESKKHAPLGGDGVVSSINGTTITVAEESDEGAGSYTVDASKAVITNNGVSATLADIKVGAKIFVKGAVVGTNVSATSISLGHGQGGKHDEGDNKNDTDAGSANETDESGTSNDTSDN